MQRIAGMRRRVATVGGLAALGIAGLIWLAPAAGQEAAVASAERGGSGCSVASVPVSNSSLQKAAQRHTKTMVATDCLAHRCPGEVDLDTRLEQAGYFDGAQKWRFAENTGCGLSTEAMVGNWMASVYHRVNILDPEFDDVGVGVSKKAVDGRCKRKYGTFTVVFGTRDAP